MTLYDKHKDKPFYLTTNGRVYEQPRQMSLLEGAIICFIAGGLLLWAVKFW